MQEHEFGVLIISVNCIQSKSCMVFRHAEPDQAYLPYFSSSALHMLRTRRRVYAKRCASISGAVHSFIPGDTTPVRNNKKEFHSHICAVFKTSNMSFYQKQPIVCTVNGTPHRERRRCSELERRTLCKTRYKLPASLYHDVLQQNCTTATQQQHLDIPGHILNIGRTESLQK